MNGCGQGDDHCFRLESIAPDIRFWVNGVVVHDWRNEGQYPYWLETLYGGRLGFRNFGGFADDVYEQIPIRD